MSKESNEIETSQAKKIDTEEQQRIIATLSAKYTQLKALYKQIKGQRDELQDKQYEAIEKLSPISETLKNVNEYPRDSQEDNIQTPRPPSHKPSIHKPDFRLNTADSSKGASIFRRASKLSVEKDFITELERPSTGVREPTADSVLKRRYASELPKYKKNQKPTVLPPLITEESLNALQHLKLEDTLKEKLNCVDKSSKIKRISETFSSEDNQVIETGIMALARLEIEEYLARRQHS